jgi:hypothetical protein
VLGTVWADDSASGWWPEVEETVLQGGEADRAQRRLSAALSSIPNGGEGGGPADDLRAGEAGEEGAAWELAVIGPDPFPPRVTPTKRGPVHFAKQLATGPAYPLVKVVGLCSLRQAWTGLGSRL